MEIPNMDRPDLTQTSTDDIVVMLMTCGLSRDPDDQAFAKACRDELARRKPQSRPVTPRARDANP